MLYNLSLLPLYVIFFIKAEKYNNLFLILSIVSLISFIFVKNKFLNRGDIIDTIKDIRKKEYEYFTFLSVFILPLFGIDIKGFNDLLVLSFILIFMGYIYTKGDFLYLNPIYLVFGWYLYEGLYKNQVIIFLSDDKNINDHLEKGYIIKQISDKFFFVKRIKNAI